MDQGDKEDKGSLLLKAVETIAINPQDAKALVAQYVARAKSFNPSADKANIEETVARKIIDRYSKMSATSGGITALTGVVPGIGTALAMVGGGLADATISMKFQVDMVMCLAETFGWDLTNEDAKHLSFLIAAGGSLEKFGVETGVQIASKAGVKMLKQYLQGAALTAVKEFFKRIGITFTRAALEKAFPFGIGVVIGATANYGLTQYVGHTAMKWFILERDTDEDEPESGSAEPNETDVALAV